MTELFRLTIPADFGNGTVEGVFEAFTNPSDEDEVRTGYLLDNSFDEALAVFEGLLKDGEPDRKGIHLDLGGGQHAISLGADVTSDATPDKNGDPLQWGSSSDPSEFDATTATGGTAMQKAQVFQNYVRISRNDSRYPATLEYGEYTSGGVLEPLDVVFEQPSFERVGPDKYRFSATFVETVDLSDSLDGSKQTDG